MEGFYELSFLEEELMNIRSAVFHSPGENWVSGVDFREQPGIRDHVDHYSRLLESGKLFMGGPFLPPASGGMMIADASMSPEELEAFASEDPAVRKGLLRYEVKSWYIAMSR